MRVLIVRVGAMGDVLHTLPAVAALRAAQPAWTLDWAVDERWRPLLCGDDQPVTSACVDVPVRAWKAAPLSLQTARSFVAFKQLRGRYDLVVEMQGTLRAAGIAWLAAGAAARVAGFRTPRERAARWLYSDSFPRQGTHVVAMNTALLSAACGVPLVPQQAALPCEAWADAWAAELCGGDRICVLAARAGWAAKQWPAERFGALAQRLAAHGFRVLVNAPARGDDVVQAVLATSRGAAEEVVCNVSGLLALLRRTRLLVGGDTGPTHLAATLGVPLVALFGPTDPARNGPWSPEPAARMRVLRPAGAHTSYSRRERHVADAPGIDALSLGEVLAAALEVSVEAEPASRD